MAKPSADYLRDMHSELEDLSEDLQKLSERLGNHYSKGHNVIRSLNDVNTKFEDALGVLFVEVTNAEKGD